MIMIVAQPGSSWPSKDLAEDITLCEVKIRYSLLVYIVNMVVGMLQQWLHPQLNRTELSWSWQKLWSLPEESQPAHTVRSAPTRGDTLDKLNSDKSACQYDLNHGRYFLSALCHIAAPTGLILSATWIFKKQGMMKEWELTVTGLTCERKRTSFD